MCYCQRRDIKISELRRIVGNELLELFSNKLACYDYTAALLDVDVLLMHLLKVSRVWILSNGDLSFDDIQKTGRFIKERFVSQVDLQKEFFELIEKRKTGLPVAYIINNKEFFGLDFYVDQSVLIPKPDTETLVELAIQKALKLLENNFKHDKTQPLRILDLCTGSGCVGIAVANELTHKNADLKVEFTFVDISKDALLVSQKNAKVLIPDVVTNFVVSDLRLNIPKGFDLILCNPPYVPTDEAKSLLTDGRSEPLLALDGGKDGLELFYPLADAVFNSLYSGGAFFIEAADYNIDKAKSIFKKRGFVDLKIYKDLAGKKRVLYGVK
ncbi:MAG: protein-(glutamine-N5) methyltransferase, release factor-specific [Treponema sp.]|nr:MAG: protein-(glutamine-N5) methyltransferase, release factor-specific [Treponema sp.]